MLISGGKLVKLKVIYKFMLIRMTDGRHSDVRWNGQKMGKFLRSIISTWKRENM